MSSCLIHFFSSVVPETCSGSSPVLLPLFPSHSQFPEALISEHLAPYPCKTNLKERTIINHRLWPTKWASINIKQLTLLTVKQWPENTTWNNQTINMQPQKQVSYEIDQVHVISSVHVRLVNKRCWLAVWEERKSSVLFSLFKENKLKIESNEY